MRIVDVRCQEMQKMRISGILTVLGLSLVLSSPNGHAQQIPRYQPDRPTVSPYLNLLRNDTGPLPSYHGLVRPLVNQAAVNRRSAQEAKTLGMAVQSLQSVNATTVSGTGTGSVFGNRSHFYRTPKVGPRR